MSTEKTKTVAKPAPAKSIPKKEPAVKKEESKPAKVEKKKEAPAYDAWKILLYPHLAEKSMGMVEFQNKLTFIVTKKATRREIAEAVEKEFQVRVKKVNVENTRKGKKKAYVTLSSKDSAADIATRLGMI